MNHIKINCSGFKIIVKEKDIYRFLSKSTIVIWLRSVLSQICLYNSPPYDFKGNKRKNDHKIFKILYFEKLISLVFVMPNLFLFPIIIINRDITKLGGQQFVNFSLTWNFAFKQKYLTQAKHLKTDFHASPPVIDISETLHFSLLISWDSI